jgi:iron complex outermembrane receptor protein
MRRAISFSLFALALLALPAGAGDARAQQALPAIEVGAASPIKRRAPARRVDLEPSRAAPAPVAARPALALPTPAAPALDEPAPRGALPIVADQFATVTVVPNEELRRSTGATLGDVLFSKPGITGSSFAPGAASRPIVRGLDNYRVRVQENGVGASGVSELGEDHGVPLDPLGIDQIEVLRGPATLRWGSQAIGGVVNATNNRIPGALPCRPGASVAELETGCARAETRGGVSTVDNGLDTALLLDAGRGNFAIHADAHGRRASDYRIPGYPYLFPGEEPPLVAGRQPNSSARSGGASLGGSYVFDAGYFGVAVTQYNSRHGIPGIESTETGTRINLRQTRVSAKGEFHPRSAYIDAIRVWAGLTDYKHHELANEEGFDGVHQSFTNKDIEARAEIQSVPFHLPFATLVSAAGVQASHQILTAPGLEGGLFDPNRSKSVAGFLFNEFDFGHGSRAQLAGRLERAMVTGSSPDLVPGLDPGIDPILVFQRNRNFTPKSGAIGFLQDLPGDMVASLTVQYVERAPRAPELLSRGIHEATGTFDIGNPNLRIEVAKSIELGLRRAIGPFRFEATVYYTRFAGFIFRNFTGAKCEGDIASCAIDGDGELREARYAQRDAAFRGGEFQSQLDVAPLLGGTMGIENQFDVVRATFSGGGNVPRIPPVRAGGGLFWRDAHWLARVNLLHAFARNNIDSIAETTTRGYNLLKAEISYRIRFDPTCGVREMTIGVAGNNLLNERIRNHVSFRKDEVLSPGANVRFFANVAF